MVEQPRRLGGPIDLSRLLESVKFPEPLPCLLLLFKYVYIVGSRHFFLLLVS